MIYLDTSYIIKCYIHEAGTPAVLRLVQMQPGRTSCLHGRAEFWSAVHRHVREGNLPRADASKVWRLFESDERSNLWRWLPLEQSIVERSCDVIEKLPPSVFLRSSDSLHLACAAENGFSEIYSNDKHLLSAAQYFGLTGRNVI